MASEVRTWKKWLQSLVSFWSSSVFGCGCLIQNWSGASKNGGSLSVDHWHLRPPRWNMLKPRNPIVNHPVCSWFLCFFSCQLAKRFGQAQPSCWEEDLGLGAVRPQVFQISGVPNWIDPIRNVLFPKVYLMLGWRYHTVLHGIAKFGWALNCN